MSYSFSDFINECIHPEIFSGNIPIQPRFGEIPDESVPFVSVGSGLFYDSVHDAVDIFTEDKIDFHEKRYVFLGSAFGFRKKEIRCISPYFIRVTFNPKKFADAKDFTVKLRESLKEYAGKIVLRTGDGVKAEIMSRQDVPLIVAALPSVLGTLSSISGYVRMHGSATDFLIAQSCVLSDGSLMLNSFGPAYLSAGEPDMEDRKDCGCVIYSFSDFKKEFPDAELFECLIPVVFCVHVD